MTGSRKNLGSIGERALGIGERSPVGGDTYNNKRISKYSQNGIGGDTSFSRRIGESPFKDVSSNIIGTGSGSRYNDNTPTNTSSNNIKPGSSRLDHINGIKNGPKQSYGNGGEYVPSTYNDL